MSSIEIGNAIVDVSGLAGGIRCEELKRETLREFAGQRLTPGVLARLEKALKDALSGGKLQLDLFGIVRINP